ncbi:MAG: hypothetical protein J6M12_05050 [Clostridia bacterium]|nr:hypothetical protein [Clostridia bacterium]
MVGFLNSIYKNIGLQVKRVAIWAFVLETVAAIVVGIYMIYHEGSSTMTGLITLICGPVGALLSFWLMFAFGELVEKMCNNEKNTRQILELLEKNERSK